MRREVTKRVPVLKEGSRDADKWFKIKELPAMEAERWAWRLALAVKGTSAQVPVEFVNMGIVGVAIRGINAFLGADVEWHKLQPLLDEMLTCVSRVPDAGRAPDVSSPLIMTGGDADDIQDVETIAWLRAEVLSLHTGFSVTDAILTLVSGISGMMPDPNTSNTSTSPE